MTGRPTKMAYVEVVDDVLRRKEVNHAHEEGERRVEHQMTPDVVQQSRLGQVCDVFHPVLGFPIGGIFKAGGGGRGFKWTRRNCFLEWNASTTARERRSYCAAFGTTIRMTAS